MKFFFPDSQDQVDPSFNFLTEQRSEFRLRHRDDHYAHEEFATPPFDGLLISMAMVEGLGRYTLPQRHRLFRMGIRPFYRLEDTNLETMGDCGAFSYVREDKPPYSVSQVVNFYDELGLDYGISVDHVILGFDAGADEHSAPKDWRHRQEITLELAERFLKELSGRGSRVIPLGVAQGWSPASYAYSVQKLQKLGFSYIAMGGMVPLKTQEILASLERVNEWRRPDTRLHLLGVTRCEQVREFENFGVASFDSTSPLRQAFKDLEDNYWTLDRTYSAIRVPQVQANPSLLKKILAGKVNQAEARRLEQECLELLFAFDAGKVCLEDTVRPILEYERLYHNGPSHAEKYRETLLAAPWKECECDICKRIGINVVLFRGAERNRRRGFHNLFVFNQRLHRELGETRQLECLTLSPGG
jgi:hypothetical protein